MKKHAGGRPSSYDESFIAKADEYLALCQDEYDEKRRVHLPKIEAFAQFLGVNKTTLYEWEKDHPEFSNALEKIRTEQLERLVDNGLSGAYNSTIAKLMLSSNHGMREKSDVTTDDKPIEGVIVLPQRNENQMATTAEAGNSTGTN
jgi:F0F1-type ATP synthase gamma subunit